MVLEVKNDSLRQRIEALLRHKDKKVYDALRDEVALLKIYLMMREATLVMGRWLWSQLAVHKIVGKKER